MDESHIPIRARSTNSWRAEEIAMLLNAVDCKHSLRVYLPGNAQAIYSSLLGVDFGTNELRLDTFHPCSLYELIALAEQKTPLTLAINVAAGTWLLRCIFVLVDNSERFYQVSLQVLDLKLSPGKRLHQRVHFSDNNYPEVVVDPPWSTRIKGELLDLSAFGCQVRIPGKDQRQHFSQRTAKLSLNFNEEFKLDCQCEIRQMQFLRVPCCQNKFRLLFKQLTSLQHEQLSTFIHNISLACAA